MATLIGHGGHARDIWPLLDKDVWSIADHHKLLAGWQSAPFLIGINDPHTRAAVASELGVEDIAWIHPSAFIGPDCEIGTGTHINYMASMTRTKLGRHCTIAPGVTICGDVTIGDRVFIGAGAVIRNLVTIGDDAFIRMGSIVTRDVEPGERY